MMLKRILLAVALVGGSFAMAPATQPAAKAYPLKICLVSDEELGGMGDPVVEVYKGQEFKFCCKSCVKQFKKDPEKYVAMLKEKTPSTQPSK